MFVHHSLHTLYMYIWLENEFLGYLDEWDAAVEAREGFSTSEKNDDDIKPRH